MLSTEVLEREQTLTPVEIGVHQEGAGIVGRDLGGAAFGTHLQAGSDGGIGGANGRRHGHDEITYRLRLALDALHL